MNREFSVVAEPPSGLLSLSAEFHSQVRSDKIPQYYGGSETVDAEDLQNCQEVQNEAQVNSKGSEQSSTLSQAHDRSLEV